MQSLREAGRGAPLSSSHREARGQDFVPQTITGVEGRASQARGLPFGQGQFSGKLEVHREHTQQVVL